jgi:hypothetical protein
MLAELGRRGDAAVARGVDAAREAGYTTVVHLRRIVGAVSVALSRVKREAQDLVWDYRDVASDLRRPDRDNTGRTDDDGEGRRPELRVV